jgi:hypothetical protein
MSENLMSILTNPTVCAALMQVWEDSQPGLTGGHEEGGFILRDSAGNLSVERWLRGQQDAIVVPSHPNCQIHGQDIVATFRTHPNTGSDYVQDPSETDKRAVRGDPHLKEAWYEGKFVISAQTVYHIAPNGQVSEVVNTEDYLGKQ